jgi:putative FmdB family regulatory protein
MPIYEYICKRCEHRFEELVLGSEQPACPSCAAEQVEKQLSVFAVNSPSGGSAPLGDLPGPCGSCGDPRGPGACSLN